MRNFGIISQIAICSGGVIGGWLVAAGQLGITSFAQIPAASSGQRSTELFNHVMDDVLGRRLTRPSHRTRSRQRQRGAPASWKCIPSATFLEGNYEVKINDEVQCRP